MHFPKRHIRFNFSIALLFLLTAVGGISQSVPVEDSVFKQFLLDTYPSVMTAEEELDTLLAASEVDHVLDLQGIGIKEMHEIMFFKNVDTIYAQGNDLDSIGIIDKISDLKYIDVSNNKLRYVPSIYGINTIEQYRCRNNLCERVPQIWTASSSMTVFDLANNNLSHLHSFNSFTELTLWDVSGNRLTFNWLLQNVGIPDFENVAIISPQQKLSVPPPVDLTEGETLFFDLDNSDDDTVTTNTYRWFRNDALVRETSYDSIIWPNVTFEDAGIWRVEVTNSHPLLSSLTLESKGMVVSVKPCLDLSSVELVSNQVSCNQLGIIEISQSSVEGGVPPITFTLINSSNSDSIIGIDGRFERVPLGLYNLKATDSDNCTQLKAGVVHVQKKTDCTPLLSPNGDGDGDDIYIDTPGLVEVFDKHGKLLTSFMAPALWDGRTSSGEIMPAGYYVMYQEGQKLGNISLVW